MEGETVFKSDVRPGSDGRMCEKVEHMAHATYRELEELLRKYDQDAVKGIMPHIVNTLETLDATFRQCQSLEVEVELLREDNEQLLVQYEREKTARRAAEAKLLEVEDAMEGERGEWRNKVGTLESIAKMLELKYKNASEHGVRLQERETEIQREYNKLYVKYKDLLKTHVDHIEHYKMLFNTDRRDSRVNRPSGPVSFGFSSLEPAITEIEHNECSIPGSPISASPPTPASLIHEAGDNPLIVPNIYQNSQEESPGTPIGSNDIDQSRSSALGGRSHTKHESRSANNLYQVLSYSADLDATIAESEECVDVTGGYVHPGEYASTANDNSNFSMGREVEKLITENQELLTIKNALNIVKDDLIAKVDELNGEQDLLRGTVATMNEQKKGLLQKIEDLEAELKLVKESVSQREPNSWASDDVDVPMSQRKRFTRVEMARVLMERNQYKEKLIELQEAVRFRDMIRASRNDPDMLDKKNKGIWKLFSSLFSSSERPPRPKSSPHLRSGPNQTLPLGIRHSRTQADFLETQVASERQTRRNTDRRDQFRQVRAHVRKEDGRTQAYGWSLPGRSSSAASVGNNPPCTSVPVPVPVFCRPLAEADPTMKVWCAAGVDRRGGYTRDGGHMVGQSVFYGETASADTSLQSEESQRHSPEIVQIEKELRATQISSYAEREISSIVWVCSSTPTHCVITVIDANNPAEVLESFTVPEKLLLCIASVPGTNHADYEEIDQRISNMADKTSKTAIDADAAAENKGRDNSIGAVSLIIVADEKDQRDISVLNDSSQEVTIHPLSSDPLDIEVTPIGSSPPLDQISLSDNSNVDIGDDNVEEGGDVANLPLANELYTVMATMWIGSQGGMLYIHSAIGKVRTCLAKIKMRDAILSIVHCASRCVVGLANGTVAVFARGPDGCWDFSQYHLVTLGISNSSSGILNNSVRCLAAVGCTVWCGHRNKVYILEPRTLSVIHALEVHPRKDSQIRQMAWFGEGVWVSIRLDSTLRMYHAHTYQHLQDVDIEPYVSKMLGTGKLGFSLVRITALLVSSGRLWIGTGNGVIISVPLSEPSVTTATSAAASKTAPLPGNIVRMTGPVTPYCTMASAQLSFHGHREEVKFFVAVPGLPSAQIATASSHPVSPTLPIEMPMLVLSGGEGYIDFRIETDMNEESSDSVQPMDNESPKKFCNNCNCMVMLPTLVQGEPTLLKCPKCDSGYYRNVSHILMWQS